MKWSCDLGCLPTGRPQKYSVTGWKMWLGKNQEPRGLGHDRRSYRTISDLYLWSTRVTDRQIGRGRCWLSGHTTGGGDSINGKAFLQKKERERIITFFVTSGIFSKSCFGYGTAFVFLCLILGPLFPASSIGWLLRFFYRLVADRIYFGTRRPQDAFWVTDAESDLFGF